MKNGVKAFSLDGSLFYLDKKGNKILVFGAKKGFNRKKGSGGFASPDISPDGSKICYTYFPSFSTMGVPCQIEEFNLVTKTHEILVKGDYFAPKYSPSGNYIMVETVKKGGKIISIFRKSDKSIYVVDDDCFSATWIP
jgi:Tol biopolymer transport system component